MVAVRVGPLSRHPYIGRARGLEDFGEALDAQLRGVGVIKGAAPEKLKDHHLGNAWAAFDCCDKMSLADIETGPEAFLGTAAQQGDAVQARLAKMQWWTHQGNKLLQRIAMYAADSQMGRQPHEEETKGRVLTQFQCMEVVQHSNWVQIKSAVMGGNLQSVRDLMDNSGKEGILLKRALLGMNAESKVKSTASEKERSTVYRVLRHLDARIAEVIQGEIAKNFTTRGHTPLDFAETVRDCLRRFDTPAASVEAGISILSGVQTSTRPCCHSRSRTP